MAGEDLQKLELIRVFDEKKLNVYASLRDDGISFTDAYDSAATIELSLHDPEWAILQSGFFDRNADGRLDAVDLELDDYWYRLQQVATQDDVLSLTFEDRNVALLRRKFGHKAASRGKMTRAQFAQSLVRSVKTVPIAFYSRELKVKQPIAAGTKDSSDKATTSKDSGFASHAKLAGFIDAGGSQAPSLDAEQTNNAKLALETAAELNAGPKATLALVEACMVEGPNFSNPEGGDSSSVGILQLLDSHLGGSTSENGGRRDVKLVCKLFLESGFTDGVGAIDFAKAHPEATAGQVAQHCQGSAFPGRYDQQQKPAKAIVEAFDGGDIPGASAASVTTTSVAQQYQFSVKKNEDYWTALTRLAQEVNWRVFVNRGVVFFMDDYQLMRGTPSYLFKASNPEVQKRNFTWDTSSAFPQEFTFSAVLRRDKLAPGDAVDIKEAGSANGRWIVKEIQSTFFSDVIDVTLIQPAPQKLEPAHTEKEITRGSGKATEVSGSPKNIIDTVVLPIGRDKDLKTPSGGTLTSANVTAANGNHGHTLGGERSDHEGPPDMAWAVDMSNGGSPTPEMDAVAKELADTFNIPWNGSGLVSKTSGKYRYQLIYRFSSPQAGNHYNHVHFGVKVVK